jgi:hypothetical protein
LERGGGAVEGKGSIGEGQFKAINKERATGEGSYRERR